MLDKILKGKKLNLDIIKEWLSVGTTPLVSVEVNNLAAKILELNPTGGGYEVNRIAIASLPNNLITENEIKDGQAVGEFIGSLRQQAGIKGINAITVMPGSSVITKQVKMASALGPEEMETQVWVEANKNFPELIDDISLDFDIVSADAESPSLLNVLLVACRKAHVEISANILNVAGFKPKVIEVDYYALERIGNLLIPELNLNPEADQTVAIFNLSPSMVTLVIQHNGTIVYTHDYVIHDEYISNQVYKSLQNIQNELKSEAKEEEQVDQQYLDGRLASLVQRLQHLLQFFYSSTQIPKIDAVILGGEIALFPSIANLLQEQLQTPVVLANPFQNMTIASSINPAVLQKLAPLFLVCAGLAIRESRNGAY